MGIVGRAGKNPLYVFPGFDFQAEHHLNYIKRK
jgi:hypothetical protein